MTTSAWEQVLPRQVMGANTVQVPLEGRLRDMVAAYAAAGSPTPASPRYAATVMLVRPALPGSGVEVFMLRRGLTMAFAPGVLAFPGGRIDDRDLEVDVPWAGPCLQEWAERLGCGQAMARGIVVAAIREVFEETGVLLAGPDETSLVDGLDGLGWDREAGRLAAHEISLAQLLVQRGLVVRSDLLGLRARWVTPEFEPRRYDTFFFAAEVPPGQAPRVQTSEAVGGAWVDPAGVLARASSGAVAVLPPTAHNLELLAASGSAHEFVVESPPLNRIMLAPTKAPDGSTVLSCTIPDQSHGHVPSTV